jgi:MFS family permease
MNNVVRYHVITFLLNLSFTLPIWVIFGTDYLHLSHVHAYWLGTFYWLVSTIFEIPTGSWADRFGRKKVYIYGLLTGIFSLSMYLFTRNYVILICSQIIAGFAVALKSGPLEALVYDWLKEQKREKEFMNITSNNLTYLFIGRVIGAVVGGVAYSLHPTLPFALLLITSIAALFVVRGMSESRHTIHDPLSDKGLISEAIKTFLHLMRKIDYAVIMWASICFSGFANMLWYAYQPYFQKLGFSGKAIGFLYIPVSIASAAGSQIVKRILPKVHTGWLYTAMLLVTALVAWGMHTFVFAAGMSAIVLLSVVFGFDNPASASYFQPYYPSKIRATINSIESLIGSLILVIASITTGYFLDHWGMSKLFLFVGVSTLSASILTAYYANTLANNNH